MTFSILQSVEMFLIDFSWLCGQRAPSFFVFCRDLLLCVILLFTQVQCVEHHSESDLSNVYYEAKIRYTYKDLRRNDLETDHFQGKYGLGHQPANANISGKLIHVTSVSRKDRTKTNHYGCEKYSIKLPTVKWIALVERGECDFTDKLRTATVLHKASALIIYDNETSKNTFMRHKGNILFVENLQTR